VTDLTVVKKLQILVVVLEHIRG